MRILEFILPLQGMFPLKGKFQEAWTLAKTDLKANVPWLMVQFWWKRGGFWSRNSGLCISFSALESTPHPTPHPFYQRPQYHLRDLYRCSFRETRMLVPLLVCWFWAIWQWVCNQELPGCLVARWMSGKHVTGWKKRQKCRNVETFFPLCGKYLHFCLFMPHLPSLTVLKGLLRKEHIL